MQVDRCCDKWWGRLSDAQKMWVHYYFYDIEAKNIIDRLGGAGVQDMHESRFELEGYER